MTRLFTFLTIILTALVSFGLYELSYEVQRLEDELLDTNRAIARERENIAVLSAEWSLMTRPDQLQRKAENVLNMRTLTARQIVSFDDIPWRKDVPKPEMSRQEGPKQESLKPDITPPGRSTPSEVPMVRAEPPASRSDTPAPVRVAKAMSKGQPAARDAQVDAVLASMARRQ